MKQIILLLLLILNAHITLGQSWDGTFYEEEVMIENADLLQLTEYQRFQQLHNVQKNIPRTSNDAIDDFYSERPEKPAQRQKKQGLSFADISKRNKEQKSVSQNRSKENKSRKRQVMKLKNIIQNKHNTPNYFIDFN